ncbi:adaptor protein MecA [Fructilactobacillus frigidiflavus]|uniref:adaptor protein MecA n=1 Tax=Fructilactobacillus frigidiflavus TaxID=3242688 RepID=UPI003757E2CD
MKYERSNENTIKVWVTTSDLKERKMNLLDLMQDKNKVENFFYSILEEVDDQHDFQNNDLVSFQILPESDGFQMIISKDNDVVSKLTEANVNFMSEQTKEKFEEIKEKNRPIDEFDEKKMTRTVPIYFSNFEEVIGAVNEIQNQLDFPGMQIKTDLYKAQDHYYLIVRAFLLPDGINAGYEEVKQRMNLIDDQLALIYEYGHLSEIHADQIQQQTKLIVKDLAVNTIKNYFV